MAQSTFGTMLYMYNTSAWKKLIPIKDFPDLGGEPEMIETTTLEDRIHTYILGIQSMDAMTFTANFDRAQYHELKGYEDGTIRYFKLVFSHGTQANMTDDYAFYWAGQVSVYVNGGGVDEVIEMTISISPSMPIQEEPFAEAPDEGNPNEDLVGEE